MRKFTSLLLLALFVLATSTARADTIHLKNGSVIKGKVTSFAEEQFIVMLDTGSGSYMSRAMIYIGDVSRIEFDSAAGHPSDASSARDTAQSTPPRDTSSIESRDNTPRDAPVQTATVPDTQQRETQPAESQVTPQREPVEPPQSERPTATPPPAVDTSDNDRPQRKSMGPVKTTNIDVAGKRDWTSTGLIIKRGDIIRITATGSVTIDPTSGQTSGPEGTSLPDPRKLMPDQPTGALIGVIGADNDEFIFIGRSAEFTATRDGLLFLSVNEGALSDNTGSYKAVIELQAQRVTGR